MSVPSAFIGGRWVTTYAIIVQIMPIPVMMRTMAHAGRVADVDVEGGTLVQNPTLSVHIVSAASRLALRAAQSTLFRARYPLLSHPLVSIFLLFLSR